MNPIARALSPVLCASVGSSPAFKYYTVQMNVGLVKGCVCCLMYFLISIGNTFVWISTKVNNLINIIFFLYKL